MFFLTVGKRVSSRFFCTLFAAHDGSAFPPAGFLVFRRFSFFSPVAFFCPVAVSSSSRQQTFFFFGSSLFFSGGLFCPVAVSSSSRQQTFFFFGGSLFRSAVFLVPQRFPSVFFRVGGHSARLFFAA
ncbi:hypothetical protein [Alistipes finegoldii]|uniref:hypothetical protein n=1 Tax=Alistipes finegoldii TaxID=214856 RepID=UPI003AEF7FED